MTAYATQGDVYKYGLPRGSLGNPGRLVDSALAATSIISLSEHSFSSGDAVTFRVPQGGTMAAPLVSGVTYYVLYLTDSTFQISLTSSGSPITLTNDGVSMIVSTDLPFAELLEFFSRFADGFIPAHVVPLPVPYPVTIVAIVAQLTAKQLQFLSGVTSISMEDVKADAAKQLTRWAAGLPVRDAAVTTIPANLSVQTSVRDRVIGGPRWPGVLGWGGGSDPSDNG